jgi:hypothetical protein
VKSVPVEIPVPVLREFPAEITADCVPRYLYPVGEMTVGAVLDRLEAVEIALAVCRNQLEVIRAR